MGFTIFFGVLDVIIFSHGDTVMLGGFSGLAMYMYLQHMFPGLAPGWSLLWVALTALTSMALLGMLLASTMIMRLRAAPALNTLLATMMLGTVLRESIRLFFPNGSNPPAFSASFCPTGRCITGSFRCGSTIWCCSARVRRRWC